MKIKIDKADRVMSQWVRMRDRACQRCLSKVRFNEKGLPVSHQASHFHGRRKESVRFDPENVITLCGGCHQYLTSNPTEHERWMRERLGERNFQLLMIRANTPGKKERQLAYLTYKTLVEKQLRK